METSTLLLDGNRGIYLPQNFAEDFKLEAFGLDRESDDIQTLLAGPDGEWYWEAWDSVVDAARYVDADGQEFYL